MLLAPGAAWSGQAAGIHLPHGYRSFQPPPNAESRHTPRECSLSLPRSSLSRDHMVTASVSPLCGGDGNAADRKAHKVVAVGKATAWHTRDASLAEEGEDVLTWLELAPVVHRAAIVSVYLEEEAVLLVHL